tara:strand:- start:9373 stop:9540 length:168 start_codon:yes stop_codon:yes gene_type:complete
LGKRLIPGKSPKDKKKNGKMYSHRPVRAMNAYWSEEDHKWYSKKEIASDNRKIPN